MNVHNVQSLCTLTNIYSHQHINIYPFVEPMLFCLVGIVLLVLLAVIALLALVTAGVLKLTPGPCGEGWVGDLINK